MEYSPLLMFDFKQRATSPCRWPAFVAPCLMLLSCTMPLTVLCADEAPLKRYHFEQVHMGAPIEIVLYAADESSANLAAAEAYARISALDQIMSDYKPTSEL